MKCSVLDIGTQRLETPFWGVYTPTLSNVANITSITPYQGTWMRLGNVVDVTIKADIDPTSASTQSQMNITLPVPRNNFASNNDGYGNAVGHNGGSANQAGVVYSVTASQLMQLIWFNSTDVSAMAWGIRFQYEVA